jgi:DASH complex subunit SPC19
MAHSLEGCVSSLRETMSLLDSSIRTLDAGVNDFPRLSKVLQTTRVRITKFILSNDRKPQQTYHFSKHFELVSESDLQSAQATLLSEIQPEVSNLLSRVSAYLDKLERREQSLIAKCELQEGRLGQTSSSMTRPVRLKSTASIGEGPTPLTGLEAMKMQQLRQKKERLSFAIDRLQLQAQQRERQLRKSMAAPQILEETDF